MQWPTIKYQAKLRKSCWRERVKIAAPTRIKKISRKLTETTILAHWNSCCRNEHPGSLHGIDLGAWHIYDCWVALSTLGTPNNGSRTFCFDWFLGTYSSNWIVLPSLTIRGLLSLTATLLISLLILIKNMHLMNRNRGRIEGGSEQQWCGGGKERREEKRGSGCKVNKDIYLHWLTVSYTVDLTAWNLLCVRALPQTHGIPPVSSTYSAGI